MRFIDKHKLKRKIDDKNRKLIQQSKEIEKIDKSVKNSLYKIGQVIVEKKIEIDNEEIKELQISINESKAHLRILNEEKENSEKEIERLVEWLRNIEGKVGCPKCGRIYELSKELCYCSKCGTSLKM